jgi:hypothetical protein
MTDQIQPDEELVKSFHLMWDHFPECVQLAHNSYPVIAVNPAAAPIGREVGMICAKHGPPERHKGCKAQQAIKEGEATWAASPASQAGELGGVVFWLPIDGYPDYYLHFAVGYSKNYIKD